MNTSPPPISTLSPTVADLHVASRQMLEKSASATAMADLRGNLTFVNSAWLQLWGNRSADAVVGLSIDTIFCDRTESATAVKFAVLEAGTWEGKLDPRHADGSSLALWCSAHMITGAEGNPLEIMMIFTNRSPTIAEEFKPKSGHDFIEAVVGAAGVLVLVLDEQGRFVRFNAECERISGWRAEEVLGRCPWDTVIPPEVAQSVHAEAFGKAMTSRVVGSSYHTNEWQARDGARHMIDWTNSLLVTADSSERFMVSIGIDVSEHRAAELRLQRAQRVAQIGAWELDLCTNKLEWSEQIYSIFEIDSTQIVATYENFLNAIHPDDRKVVNTAYVNSLATRDPYRIQHRLQMPDGRIKWVEERCETDFDAQGKPLRSLGTVQDISERHQRDAELDKFRFVVEQGPQEVWLIDTEQSRVHYVNHAAAASLGYEANELIGMSVTQIDTGGEAFLSEKMRQMQVLKIVGGGPLIFEVEHRTRDGRLVPKEIRASEFVIDGKVLSCAFAADISERRRTDAALRSSQNQLLTTLNAYPGWVACIDDLLHYTFVNERFADKVGRSPAEIVGHTVDQLLGPDAADEIRAINRRLLLGESIEYERRITKNNGEERIYWIQHRVESDTKAQDCHVFYSFANDITESRRTQQRLQALVEATRTATWEWAPQARHVEFNAQMAALIGYSVDDLPVEPARWLLTTIHKDDRSARKARFKALLSGQVETIECEYRAHHRDGRLVWLLDRGRTVTVDALGQPTMVLGSTQDVSTLKSQEIALLQLNTELEQRVHERTHELEGAKAIAERASAAKTEFLSRMSHELRTPLNAIIGFSQLLELLALPVDAASHVQEVLLASHHLLYLINEVLDLTTVESGRIELSMEAVPVSKLLNECVSLIRPASQKAGLLIHINRSADCLHVMADVGRLKQVMLNLLSNAVKYNQPGGRIVIDCRHGEANACEITVADTGAGLTPSQVKRLFQPFERLGAAHGDIQGTGIGLSVSKRLVELMGGEIGASSIPGKGSRFWLRLPEAIGQHEIRFEDNAGAPVPSRVDALDGPIHKILYVEDNLANQRLMKRILEHRYDVELTTTGDPLAVVEIVRTMRPSLILMDIQLPQLDGYELLAKLHAEDITIPLVAVSANAMESDITRSIKSGFAGYLIKPLQVPRVLAVINGFLPAPEGATRCST